MDTAWQYLWSRRHILLPQLITFLVFLAVANLSGFLYRGVGLSSTVLLSPAGVGFAAVVIEGYIVLPAIALAVVVNGILNGAPLLIVIGSTIGNVLQAFVAGYILRSSGFDRKLATLKDMFSLVTVALLVSMIVPTVNLAFFTLDTLVTGVPHATPWLAWWIGGAVSMLVIAPLFIRWIKRPMTPRTREVLIETVGVILFVCITSWYLFGTNTTSVFGVSLIFVLVALLFWLAFRAGPRFMTLALFLMTIISFVGALYGTYTPTEGGLPQRLFNTQVFDLFIAFFFFVLVSLEEQRKQAVTRLSQQNLKLQGTVNAIATETEAKNEFIATLAHELRNPLAPLLTSVDTLRLSAPPQSELSKTLESMDTQIKTMGYLLDDLLDISRITERKLELQKAPIAVERMVRRAVDMTMPSMTKFNHSLTVTLPSEPIAVVVDSLRMEQVMVNLLHNSAKYTPVGGQIDLVLDYTDGVLQIVVRDTGIGISPTLMDRIFEPFVQIHDPTIRRGGIGIGLALTKNLVEMHEGTISVAPGPGNVGTEFTIRVPAPLQRVEDVPQPTETPTPPAGLSILIVDDNQEAAQSLSKLLGMRGHHVTTVFDGVSAVSEASINRPDVVILDIGLPDISGYEVAARLRAAGVKSLLIALTGYGLKEDIQKAEDAGFDHHLTKPVGLSTIEPVLAKAVKGKKQKAR